MDHWPLSLDWLERETAARDQSWRASQAIWKVTRGRITDKPSAWLDLDTPTASGQLIVWVSGEAEMVWGPLPPAGQDVQQEHYELTGPEGLRWCLDDLETRLGLRP